VGVVVVVVVAHAGSRIVTRYVRLSVCGGGGGGGGGGVSCDRC